MSRLSIDDTIVAIASPPGPGLRGIVRISGPATAACISPFAETETQLSEIVSACSLKATLQLDPTTRLGCDILYWPDERSYTRQPSAEIHMTGSRPLLEWAMECVCQYGARLATAGEFTLRAFLSGRIDLTQAEAVMGVIDATGAKELEPTLTQLAGGLAGPLTAARDQLLHLSAELEAGLDFSEEDIEFITAEELAMRLADCNTTLQKISQQVSGRKLSQTSMSAVLVGWPNAGKSSLFNQLVSGQAIVSDQAGTTRDYLSGSLQLGELQVELFDTAGVELGDASNAIRAAAQRATQQQLESANVRILCLDGGRETNQWEQEQLGLDDYYHLVVRTKSDQQIESPRSFEKALKTSSVNGQGIDELKLAIGHLAVTLQNAESSVVASTAARAKTGLRLAAESIERATQANHASMGEELVAAEIRVALDQLSQVVGTVYTDDILDIVFGKFCIGK